MADLLECLLQIRGLHETLTRLDGLTRAAGLLSEEAASEARLTAEALAVAERAWLAALAAALPGERADRLRAAARDGRTPRDPLVRFALARHAALAALDTCTAGDLAAVGDLDTRGPSRVADTVAYMLAHDIECLGALRRTVDERTGPDR